MPDNGENGEDIDAGYCCIDLCTLLSVHLSRIYVGLWIIQSVDNQMSLKRRFVDIRIFVSKTKDCF